MSQDKPSFFESVISGIKGYIKGFFAGGAVGGVTGLLVGSVIGLFTGGVPVAAAAGLAIGTSLFAGVGALSGTVTEVVKTRQKIHRVSPQDVINVANIAFAQGVEVGHQATMEQAQEVHAAAAGKFQEMIEQQRAQAELNPQKIR